MSDILCYSIVTIRNLCLFCNNSVLVLNAGSVHPSGTLTEGSGRAPQNAAERPQNPFLRGRGRIMPEKRIFICISAN